MNILIAINSAYMQPAKVMLYSLAVHNLEELNVYLLYNNIKKEELRSLGDFISRRCHGELHPIEIDGTCFQRFSVGGHFSIETYYRIYAQYLLPQDMERILWLDADIIVKGAIAEFYEQDFLGNCLIVCENNSDVNEENIERLNLRHSRYFNAGVILMNPVEMRCRKERAGLESLISDNLPLFKWQDQDILNLVYQDCSLFADEKFNCQVGDGRENVKEKIANAVILHYVGAKKPWQYYYKDDVKKILFSIYEGGKCGRIC